LTWKTMKLLNKYKKKLYKLEAAMTAHPNTQWIAEHRGEWRRKCDEMAACKEALDNFFHGRESAEYEDNFDFEATVEKMSGLAAELTKLMESVGLAFTGYSREEADIMKMALDEHFFIWNGSLEECERLRQTILAIKEHYAL